VSLRDISRSNPVHVALVDAHPTLVVKQAGPVLDSPCPLAAEAAAYRWLMREPRLAGIAPAVAAFPGDVDWLVLEAVPSARPAHELLATFDGDLRTIAAELAPVLARLHSASAATDLAATGLPARRPWVLDLPDGDGPDFVRAHPLARSLVERLRAHRDLSLLLQNLAEDWAAFAVIHGDVKWDNVLVRFGPNGRWHLWLIDWELAGLGDPAWDLASLVEGILTASISWTGTLELESVGTLVREVSAAYVAGGGRLQRAGNEGLVRMVIARLVQVQVQLAAMTGEQDATSAVREQLWELSCSLTSEPEAWRQRLFGESR
jgi:aminoglycoside phosphotransferase (APT) family kinase protein